MFELKVITQFAAAHRLTMVGRQCENLHGHNWRVEVCVAGASLDKGGVLVDFGVIKSHLREIIQQLDHQFLNELPGFGEKTPPSSEHIAVFIANDLQKRIASLGGVRVSRVSAWESDTSCATYIPD